MYLEPVLKINNLTTSFNVDGKYYSAIDDIDLEVYADEVLALVGESGCGKSTLATSVMGLHNMNTTKISGSILFKNKEIVGMDNDEMDSIRGSHIGMIFQDPLAALNPLQRVGDQIKESLDIHTNLSEENKKNHVLELLNQVGIVDPKRTYRQFPHELSGGMRQRIMIAMAIACKPELIIADEPTTALDVTIQAQILDLLRNIQKENHAGIIMITHDLGVVAEMADRVAVMYAGQIVEIGTANQIFKNPKHPYTRSLLKSMPQADTPNDELYVIQGMVPSIKKMKHEGCRFADRIPWMETECHESNPQMHDLGEGHQVRCTCYKDFEFN